MAGRGLLSACRCPSSALQRVRRGENLALRHQQDVRHSFSVSACARRGNPRPDAAEIEAKRAQVATSTNEAAYAPKASLFALELQAERHTPEALKTVSNRFPLRDRFSLPDGRSLTSGQILSKLEGDVQPERLAKIEQVVSGRCFSVVPLLEGVFDRGNIGAVARTADALGFGALHYVKTLDPRRMRTGSGARTSGGSQKWLDMQVWESVGACLRHMKASGFFVAATHLAPESVPISCLDWTRPTVVVLGNESYGVSREALSLADQAVIIPQAPGFVDSFNVSVAAALTLYEARSSRLKALGRHGNLSEEQQRVLTAAMLLRHKDCNANIRQSCGLSLDSLNELHAAALLVERSWTEERQLHYSGRRQYARLMRQTAGVNGDA